MSQLQKKSKTHRRFTFLVADCRNGDVRLIRGRNSLQGRVEVCYDGVWGTVCSRGWDREDANVVCRQLGLSGSGT